MRPTFDRFARVSALRPAMKRARLASAVTGAQDAPPARDHRRSRESLSGADALSALLGGACQRNHCGEHFVVRRWYAQPGPCPPLGGALQLLDPRAPRIAADPARWLFLDTETTGLAGGTGTYAFLVGLAWWDSAGLQVEQFFLRDFDDEHSMLTALAARLTERPVLVTFNGKSFDWPLLETRYRMTRSLRVPEPAAHLDLLHPARQVWRLRLGSVRLSELERAVLGAPSSRADWDRAHDVRSEMIPHIYFQYLRGGSPVPLLDVFRHNQMDLRGLAAIAVRMAALLDAPESADAPPLDLYGLSRLVQLRQRSLQATARSRPACVGTDRKSRTGSALNCSASSVTSAAKGSSVPFAQARQLCERALASGLPAGLDRAALRDLAALAKRQRDFSRACALWHELAGTTSAGHPERSEGSAFPVHRHTQADSSAQQKTPGLGMTSFVEAPLTAHTSPLAPPSLDSIEACEQLAMHYEHRARQPERALDYARHALDALRRAARAALLTPAQAARLRARLDRRIARLELKSGEKVPLCPPADSASPGSLLPLQVASGIARTPLRRASKRTPAEPNDPRRNRGGLKLESQ
jgi:uncharacterized protein YprB with RNaseH-like and TPR domain